MNLNFSNLTAPNGALQKLSEIIFAHFMQNEKLSQITRIMPAQQHGKKVSLLKGFEMQGQASEGCNVTWNNTVTNNSEQTWDIQEWQVSEYICYETLKGTLAQLALKHKVKVADLTGSEYIDDILMPFMEQALLEMLLRFVFFGDKAATTYNASTNPTGTLKAGTDKKYFDVINGFWKLIFTGVSGGTIGRTTIAANAETSTAQQRNTLHVSGTASDLLDQVIEDASIELTQADGQLILCTKSVWDAVKRDVKHNNKGSEMQFESWFSGIKYTEWDGIPMIVLPFWDKIIRSYMQNTTNTSAYNLPHRVIYTCKDNLLVGTESQNDIAEIDYWFDKKEQKNYILSKDTIGTMILDPNLIHVAY